VWVASRKSLVERDRQAGEELIMHWWDGGAHMGWMAIWWVFGIGLIAVLFAALARGTLWQGPGSESPELILKRRYAKGEIDRDAYERMLSDLKK
jgi:putative membrane protein